MVCLLAAPWVKLSVSAGNGWPHNALRHHWLMPISCHFRHCKALLVTSLTHASGAITSVQTFTFTYTSYRIVSARAIRVLCTALVVPAGWQRQWCIVVPSTSLSARRRRVIDHIGAAWSVVAIDATPVASAAALRCTAADDTESRNHEITMSLNFQSIKTFICTGAPSESDSVRPVLLAVLVFNFSAQKNHFPTDLNQNFAST